MEPYIGQVQLFSFNFPPKDWAFCDGRLLSIVQNQALFSLIRTTYGGDGITTFALPALRGRIPIGFGQGPGLTSRQMGEESGTESVTLISSQMPAHNHLLMASSQPATQNSPENHLLAISNGLDNSSQPHNNVQPYLAMNYCIALYGVFPSRG